MGPIIKKIKRINKTKIGIFKNKKINNNDFKDMAMDIDMDMDEKKNFRMQID